MLPVYCQSKFEQLGSSSIRVKVGLFDKDYECIGEVHTLLRDVQRSKINTIPLLNNTNLYHELRYVEVESCTQTFASDEVASFDNSFNLALYQSEPNYFKFNDSLNYVVDEIQDISTFEVHCMSISQLVSNNTNLAFNLFVLSESVEKRSPWLAALTRYFQTISNETTQCLKCVEIIGNEFNSNQLLSSLKNSTARMFRLENNKLVTEQMIKAAPAALASRDLCHDSAYLVVGSLYGLGGVIANWMVERGAGKVFLLSRTASIKGLSENNTINNDIQCLSLDITDKTKVTNVISEIARQYPIKGLVHAAAVLEDATHLNQSPESLKKVLLPKTLGSSYLLEALQYDTLDFVIFCSSIASVLGLPGQSAYSAANAFLDQFSIILRQQGINATSVNFGAIEGIGMFARMEEGNQKKLVDKGVGVISLHQFVQVLDYVRLSDKMNVIAGNFNYEKLAETFSQMIDIPVVRQTTNEESQDINQSIESLLKRELLNVLTTEADLTDKTDFFDIGLDSLGTLELASNLSKRFGITLNVADIFSRPTIRDLASHIEKGDGVTKPVVCFKGPDNRPPLFLLPGILGEGLVLRELALELSKNQTVYVVQTDRCLTHSTDMGYIGKKVAEQIIKILPYGSIRLCGHSFGARVCWEVAQHLTVQNYNIDYLAIIDSPVNAGRNESSAVNWNQHDKLYDYVSALTSSLGKKVCIHNDDSLDSQYVLKLLKSLGVDFPLEELDKRVTKYYENLLAYINHRLTPNSALNYVFLHRAKEYGLIDFLPSTEESKRDPLWGWKDICHHINLSYNEGDHYTMIEKENAVSLASSIEAQLQIISEENDVDIK